MKSARFDPTKDWEIVVLFEWAGAAGPHRLGVQWRSPDGANSTSSAIDRGSVFGIRGPWH